METDRNNISKKFKEIKNQFGYSTNNNNKNHLKKNKSYSNYNKRPKLTKTKHKSIEKTDLNNILDQIGNDDLIFNNDKLITNIKIESFDSNLKKNSIISNENDKSFISKKTNKTDVTSNYLRKNNSQKNNSSQNRNKIKELSNFSNSNHYSLELNCNKMPFASANNKKKQNHNHKNGKKNKSTTKNKNGVVKNVDQFINKPNETRKSSNQNGLMTPITKKSSINSKKFLKNNLHSSKRSFLNFNNNDSISLVSTSRLDMSKSFVRGRSMPSKRSNRSQSNLRLPNKSVIKNKEKVILELQKLFGEKIQLSEDEYQNWNEVEKKNCIIFLLEAVKELNNSNKINKTKTDGYRQIIETKEQEIKNYKNEIKELKKENLKLNKIIKTNNQLNKKLIQNIDNLKMQLEKEKVKNKTSQTRGKSTSKINKIYSNKYLIENSINKHKKPKEFKSQDKIIKASGFVNNRKTENNKDKKINNIEINNINDKKKINMVWKNNEENKADSSPNSLVINNLKEKNEVEVNSGNSLKE